MYKLEPEGGLGKQNQTLHFPLNVSFFFWQLTLNLYFYFAIGYNLPSYLFLDGTTNAIYRF